MTDGQGRRTELQEPHIGVASKFIWKRSLDRGVLDRRGGDGRHDRPRRRVESEEGQRKVLRIPGQNVVDRQENEEPQWHIHEITDGVSNEATVERSGDVARPGVPDVRAKRRVAQVDDDNRHSTSSERPARCGECRR